METKNILTEEALYLFLKEHGNNPKKRGIIAFCGKHSDANFSRRVICRDLYCSKLEAEGMLGAMVKEGILDKTITRGVALYSLTTNEEIRRPILELAAHGWDRWNTMIKHMERADKSAKCRPEEETTTGGKL